MTDDDRVSRLARLEERSRRARGEPPPPETPVRATANVCEAAGCLSRSSDAVESALADALVERGIADVAVKRVGCLGPCALGPLVQIAETGALFDHVDADALDPVLDGLASGAPDTSALAPYFAKQVKVVLANSGRVDPESIDDYLAEDGYEALRTVVSAMQPADVVDEVVRSGLRGRGGAGYPTGLKWQTVAKAGGEGGKYVICNADEGDPGAFMDRSVLESDPQRVLEGMAIAGYAVGADHGYVYVRAEYPLAVKRLRTAIRQAEARGLLGGNVADSAFEFHVEVRHRCRRVRVRRGDRADRLRGRRARHAAAPASVPRGVRPLRPADVDQQRRDLRQRGQHHPQRSRLVPKPSARRPVPGRRCSHSPGAVVNGGLIEVPMGVSLETIVFDIGGGIPDGHRFKAVQTGGPSGGCIPEAFLDMAVDYESLASVGSIMGSGGMIVMDDSSCMVDVAKYFMDFCREESCGKCIPCRVGTVADAWVPRSDHAR